MTVLVTGAAGFIGSATCAALANSGFEVYGVDSISDYYSRDLKWLRVKNFLEPNGIKFEMLELADHTKVNQLIDVIKPEAVIHLAAQAGVRTPVVNLTKYVDANLVSFSNILEAVISHEVPNFLYASSSSVYGNTSKVPYNENEIGLQPKSFYGSTKLANEIFTKSVIESTKTRAIGMRFFTVYGPWGRPDMAYFRIFSDLLSGSKFELFGDGSVKRDFTYIDDTTQGIVALLQNASQINLGNSEIFNIGGGNPVSINELISAIEIQTGSQLKRNNINPVNGDVMLTMADFAKLESFTSFKPTITLTDGLKSFFNWANQEEIRNKLATWAESVS
jgi:UDP-glucuronate 4-epimerase